MDIKKIIREELDGLKDSSEEDFEWTEGDVDLKHILDITLEGSDFLILTAEEEAEFWGRPNVTPGYEDLIFLYEEGEMSEGHYVTFKRSQTLEEVIGWIYNHINNSRRPQVVIDEFIVLYDVIKNRAEKLFGMDVQSLYENIREESEGFLDSSEEDFEWTKGVNSDLPIPPKELDRMLRHDEYSGLSNRIIVNFEDSDLDGNWYTYDEGFYSEPEWEDMTYTNDKDEQERIIFDQDVLPNSEKSKVCKMWKKWLLSVGFKVKEVYLGDR